jgi:hypothetical protein
MKKLLTKTNLLILGGVLVVGYFIFKKKKAANIQAKEENPNKYKLKEDFNFSFSLYKDTPQLTFIFPKDKIIYGILDDTKSNLTTTTIGELPDMEVEDDYDDVDNVKIKVPISLLEKA